MTENTAIPIFLGEDDDDDAYFFERAVARTHPECCVLRFTNGAELIIELRRIVRQGPAMVFLDLAMPMLNGFETLGQIRQTPSIARIPIFVLSASAIEQEIKQAYAAGADGYIIKPVTVRELRKLIKPAITYGINLLT